MYTRYNTYLYVQCTSYRYVNFLKPFALSLISGQNVKFKLNCSIQCLSCLVNNA